jgi:putative ABC transport system permease protein
MISALWQVSSRQWRTHSLRVAMTTLGIALGVAVFFAVRTANAALLDSLTLTVERLAGKSTLEVTAGEAGFPEETLDTVRATPGVQLAEPVIEVIVHTAFQDEGNLLILGVDTTGDQQLRQYEFDRSAKPQIADPLTYLAQPNSILLSRAFAERHGLQIGDHFPIFTSHGKMDFAVEGIFKPTGVGEVFGGNIAVMDIYSAQVVFNRGHNFDRIDLTNSPGVPVNVNCSSGCARVCRRALKSAAGDEGTVAGKRGDRHAAGHADHQLYRVAGGRIHHLQLVHDCGESAVEGDRDSARRRGGAGKHQRDVSGRSAADGRDRLGRGDCGLDIIVAAAANRAMGSIAASVYGIVTIAVAPRLHPDLVLTAFALGMAASLGGAWMPARAASYLNPILALHNIESRQKESALGLGARRDWAQRCF